ncbi:MAG: hypothetical protein JSV04_02040, partial [Candidatus Heimdallarchaeota archaeon]
MSDSSVKMKSGNETRELDTEFKIFLKEWFSGLLEGKENINDDDWLKILKIYERASTHIHSGEMFWNLWEATRSVDAFISKINEIHGVVLYKRIDSNTILVNYPTCRCPLVKFDILQSPFMCNCDNWLKENFETILQRPVKVFTE